VPDAAYRKTAERSRNLPKLVCNHVEQISLGASESALSAGLPIVAGGVVAGPHLVSVEGQSCIFDSLTQRCSCGDTGCEGPVLFKDSPSVCSSISSVATQSSSIVADVAVAVGLT